jgi:TDG/mug DNA glycosylase family protein
MFVGYNPGETSARLGHYYAFQHNLFWTALYRSGLVPERLTFIDDNRLPEFGIGITDLAKRPSRAASDLPDSEFRAGREALREKIRYVHPLVVAFNGKGVYEKFAGKSCKLGVQDETIAGARLFVLPSTSPRYAFISQAQKIQWFRKLKKLLDCLSRQPRA